MFATASHQIQYACCLIQLILWFIPILIIRHAMMKEPSGANNSNPREQYESLPGYAARAANAHTNTMEGFVWFGFGILGNILGQGDSSVATILCLAYTLCRIVYLPLYIFNYPTARTALWNIGFLSTLGLFVLPFVSHST